MPYGRAIMEISFVIVGFHTQLIRLSRKISSHEIELKSRSPESMELRHQRQPRSLRLFAFRGVEFDRPG